jgi:hypothetical protein
MPKRKVYRRLVGSVELPKTDAELLAEAARDAAEWVKGRSPIAAKRSPLTHGHPRS